MGKHDSSKKTKHWHNSHNFGSGSGTRDGGDKYRHQPTLPHRELYRPAFPASLPFPLSLPRPLPQSRQRVPKKPCAISRATLATVSSSALSMAVGAVVSSLLPSLAMIFTSLSFASQHAWQIFATMTSFRRQISMNNSTPAPIVLCHILASRVTLVQSLVNANNPSFSSGHACQSLSPSPPPPVDPILKLF